MPFTAVFWTLFGSPGYQSLQNPAAAQHATRQVAPPSSGKHSREVNLGAVRPDLGALGPLVVRSDPARAAQPCSRELVGSITAGY